MSHEIELKLALPRKALAALRRNPVIVACDRPGNAVTLENTYYDTAELALKRAGVAIRTRRQGRVWLQTIKCAAESAGGLSQRPEWEQAFDGTFDFSVVTIPKIRKLLERHRDELVPVFSTRFRRETRIHAPDERTRILVMTDTGEVTAGEHTEPICEVELELDRGQPLDLLLLACQLVADVPMLPSDISKAERGYRLHLGEPLQPLRAEPSRITAGQTPVEAFRTLAFSCIRQWQANAAGASISEDPEYIHQLRVSQRRLRSLLKLFAPALPQEFVADWSERIKDNAARFGDARDLDVLYEEILSPVAGTSVEEDAALARLQGVVRSARDTARTHASANLDPAAQGRLMLGLSAALLALPSGALVDAADLTVFARLQLTRLRKKIRRRHEAARDLVPTRLHALRIALKQLRYGMEFFAPLMPAKPAERYTKALARSQNALGFINDVDVARARLAAWAGDDPILRAATGFACGWHGPRYTRLSRRAIVELEPLLWGKAPWA
ncbi:MAG: CHAD domain-containing protein [Rhodocyclaceae bacterium]